MPVSVLVAFLLLTAAAALLAVEVWTGQGARARAPWRTAVFGAAAVAGATLLTALSGGEWVLAAALVPLTALCVLRFGTLVAPGWKRWARLAVVAAVLVGGVVAGLQVVPVPLTREHLAGRDAAAPPEPPRPHARRPVRG